MITVCWTKPNCTGLSWEKLGYVNICTYGPCWHHLQHNKIPLSDIVNYQRELLLLYKMCHFGVTSASRQNVFSDNFGNCRVCNVTYITKKMYINKVHLLLRIQLIIGNFSVGYSLGGVEEAA